MVAMSRVGLSLFVILVCNYPNKVRPHAMVAYCQAALAMGRYPSCGSIDIDNVRTPCTLTSADDTRFLQYRAIAFAGTTEIPGLAPAPVTHLVNCGPLTPTLFYCVEEHEEAPLPTVTTNSSVTQIPQTTVSYEVEVPCPIMDL